MLPISVFSWPHVWELVLWVVSGGEVLAPDASHENAPWLHQSWTARGFCAGPGQARTLAGAVFRREGWGLSERFWCVWKVPSGSVGGFRRDLEGSGMISVYLYVYVYINIMTVFEVEWFCFWKFRKVQEGSVVPQAFGRFQRCLKAVWLKDYISSQSFKKLWKVLKGSKQFWRQGWEVLKTVGDTTWACLLWAWLTALLTRPKAMSPLLWLVLGVGPLPFSWRWSTLSSCWQGY